MCTCNTINTYQIRINKSIKPPTFTQNCIQQIRISGTRNTVNRIIRSHDSSSLSHFNSTLETWEVFIQQSTQTDICRITVMSTSRYTVCCHVLQSSIDMTAVFCICTLHSLHKSRTQNTGQIRILSEGFFYTRPSRFTGYIQDRTVSHVCSLQTSFQTDNFTHPTNQIFVPSRSLTNRSRESGSTYRHVAMRTFLSKKYRNTQTGILHCIFLHGIQSLCRQFRIQSGLQRLLCPRICTQYSPIGTDRSFVHLLFILFGYSHTVLSGLGIHFPT